jgi:hypothetical protein
MNYKTRTHVDLHIVDALEEKWASVGLSESAALRYRLRYTRINIVSHYCWDVASLENVIRGVASYRASYGSPRRAIPYLHIASHGSADGITLGDSHELPWAEFSRCLLPLQRKIDFTLPLSLSSCHGFYGYQLGAQSMKAYEKKRPFHTLVGPQGKLSSVELFDAFATLYFYLLHRFRSLSRSVAAANDFIKDPSSHLKFATG